MLKPIKQFWIQAGESQNMNARWLSQFLTAAIVASFILIVLALLPTNLILENNQQSVVLGFTSAIAISLIMLVYVRKGAVRLPSFFVAISMFAAVVIITLWIGEARTPFFSAYFVVVALASLFLGSRWSQIFGILSMVAVAFAGVSDYFGWLNFNRPGETNLFDWIIPIASLGMHTMLLTFMARIWQTSAEEVHRTAVALAEANKELQSSQKLLQEANLHLESKVANRTSKLRDREAKYRVLVDSAPDAIIIYDLKQRSILDANHPALQLFGHNHRSLRKSPVSALLHDPDFDQNSEPAAANQELANPMEHIISQFGRAFFEGIVLHEWHGMHRDGTSFPCELRVVPFPATHDRVVRLSILDITARKEAEAELETARLAILQAQKLDSLGILAGGIAHDFNNLLLAMLAQSDVALRKMQADHAAAPHITKARKAAHRAAELTQKMLAFSGRGQFEIRTIDIHELIDENVQLFESNLLKEVTITSDLSAGHSLIEGDSSQIQQVVMNLIINAAEAVEHIGTLSISTCNITFAKSPPGFGHVMGQELPLGDYICIVVKDTGKGMSKETLINIFDPFFTTKDTGSGLGLAAVLGIMRGHNGGIKVESAEGEGTQFTLLFPTAPPVKNIYH